MSRNLKREKSNNKQPEQDKRDNTPQPQEGQKEEGLFSLLKRFVKKILEKLLDEDKKAKITHIVQRNLLREICQITRGSMKV